MRVLFSGASGLVGSALVPALERAGHEVRRLVRRAPRGPAEIAWDPAAGSLDPAALAGVDAAINLAGVGIASRWTTARRQAIRDSRVRATSLLASTLAALEPRPRVLVSGSASGWYGDRGDEPLDEDAAPGTGFLAETARAWEAAAEPARRAGLRVVHPRLGMVLARRGGALGTLLLPFRLGLGGPVGSGRQWWSWIALDDLAAILVRLLEDEAFAGPVNVTGHPVRQRDFAATLGRVLRRPALLPTPAVALRLALGGMADELLLASQRMVAGRLDQHGVPRRVELEPALRAVLADGPG